MRFSTFDGNNPISLGAENKHLPPKYRQHDFTGLPFTAQKAGHNYRLSTPNLTLLFLELSSPHSLHYD